MSFLRHSTIWLRSRVVVFTCLVTSTIATAAPLQLKADDVAERAGPTDLVRFTVNASHYYFGDIDNPDSLPLLFLPPKVPVIYADAFLRNPLDDGVTPPDELAPHVHDLFYPQLAARLAADSLPRRIRVRLEAYRNNRQKLQEQLLARNRETAVADTGTLDDEIGKLETEAEQIRHELGTATAGHPAVRPPPITATAERAQYMRSIAFYLDGISRNQRRLLLTAADTIEFTPNHSPTPTRLFIAPEGGRIPLATATQALERSLEAYTQEQGRILDELLQGIAAANDLAPRQASARLAELAEAQTTAFAALDSQANSIRAEIRTFFENDQGKSPAPPAKLAQRLAAYQDHKQELFKEIYSALPQATRTAPGTRAPEVAGPGSDLTPVQLEKLAALKKERAALRAALVEHRRQNGSSTDRKSIDDLLEEFAKARRTEELHQKYRTYREALLQPALSPAERRLLFDYALQTLQLPLPTGEPIRKP